MEFNSLAYAVFFGIIIALYFAPFMRTAKRQNLLVLAGSYLFYGSWDWRFLGLIILTTVSSWLCALAIERWRRKFFLVANIALNIGILCIFKYFNFFAENLSYFLKWFNWEVDWVFLEVLLPVGISFYTFQAIGYTVDVWRREIKPTRNLLLFSTFIAYFPQLVAGPIERASKLLPQLDRVNRWSYPQAVEGMRLILWGMFKKVAVADPCGTVVNTYFSLDADSASWIKVYIAAVLFAVQVYCDFSGYSDIARGSARIMGVDLMDNFRRPFFSRSFIELWRRWHISLMDWFRDYVYIPLGGSRKGAVRSVLNVIVVFTLSGLWHGASWNCVLWGFYCGVACVVVRRLGGKSYKNSGAPQLGDALGMAVTFSLFIVGTTIFRVPDIMKSLQWNIRYVIPVSIALCLAVWLLTVAVRALARRGYSLIPLPSWRNAMMLLVAGFVALAVLRPSQAWFHMYYLTAALVMLCEWRTRRADMNICPFPNRRGWRYLSYFALYLLIMAYGFFELPPIEGNTQFFYFQF